MSWIPDACSLPVADRSPRLAEFDELISASLHRQERVSPTELRWYLDRKTAVQDLVRREESCCTFFTFTVLPAERFVRVTVQVPLAYTAVLDALEDRAYLSTGQVAVAAGVNRQTLRYYERRGLLVEPARSLGGHRRYPPGTVTRIRGIKAAQRLGYTLREMLHQTPDFATKLSEVETRIAELEAVAGTLRAAADAGCDDLEVCVMEPNCPISF